MASPRVQPAQPMREADRHALEGFDQLPGSAHVRLPVVASLFSISPATVWRWSRHGELPKPIHVGGLSFWRVDELREKLDSRRSQESELPEEQGDD